MLLRRHLNSDLHLGDVERSRYFCLSTVDPSFGRSDIYRVNHLGAILKKNMLVFVTRPEAIKKCPLVNVPKTRVTSFAATLACNYLRIPIGHVEAGLRARISWLQDFYLSESISSGVDIKRGW